MSSSLSRSCTAFTNGRILLSGPLVEVALGVKAAMESGSPAILVFDDETGGIIDLDLRGTKTQIVERLSEPTGTSGGRYRQSTEPRTGAGNAPRPKGRGRPKMGVVAREVTLLPRQWDWLASQPGGASATLRRLVDEAKRNGGPGQARRAAQEAAYRFMHAIGGDLPGFEEATRALFADDHDRLERVTCEWPQEVRGYALRLARSPQPVGPSS